MIKTKSHREYHEQLEALDDTPDNISGNENLNELVQEGRRNFMKGGLGLAITGFIGGSLLSTTGCSNTPRKSAAAPAISFKPIPVETGIDFDSITVPEGYTAQAFFSWGDPVENGSPAWKADGSNSWQDQMKQAGQNHDGMWFFPFDNNPNSHGLLVINHEYINQTLHPSGITEITDGSGKLVRDRNEVRKEMAAHGVSIIEVKKDTSGNWVRVADSRFNRRITGMTPMELTGIAAGTDALKTADDPSGTTVLGTLNNCAMGVTPWGTYLTCEENWKNYFVNRNKEDYEQRMEHNRYGLAQGENAKYLSWDTAEPRFNATLDDSMAHGGYVNEPNRFGWVVEIDPFDPTSMPKKRTSMGRLVRECASLSLGDDNRLAYYFGDDTRGEYVYKFVADKPYRPNDKAANSELLDHGTLYAAAFHEDGKGEWLPLIFGQGGLTRRNGFRSQADVLINARRAADIAGATTMDRPEWVAVHPQTREVFVTLTNNKHRGKKEDQPTNAANPRVDNRHGQIIRFNEQGADPTATTFDWEMFLLAGDRPGATLADGSIVKDNHIGTIKGDIFSSPDGLWFDFDGRLWIQTDYGDNEDRNVNMGTNQMLCCDTVTEEVKRFLVGPRGCEITGVTTTPDGRSMWVNVQHPALSYPASDGKTRPRSTTVLITKNDGGVIGT
ncbi:PhoX family protein [Sansalvadorimonas verongulae]|uniref:PhoX family protein n=1 Tax=Sansalvadorimonas verongulae TaxID=2172824 RepID=UPI0012BD0531|nr:PhoX family phosphatase [Sansalvadorimonas verongulae]MTI12123.1 PhoX family phosphatase [Sansalvadorimonas verongulae]